MKTAVFGGIYNNWLALEAVLEDAARRGATEFLCLGDLGGFGPHPDRVFPVLDAWGVEVMQGNYDHSIGNALADCGCGYTDPRDNYFAQLSYDYTFRNTSAANRERLRALPTELRRTWGGQRVLFAHGSPRQTNEFLWESTSPTRFLRHLLDAHDADVLFVTHTGIWWRRELGDHKLVLNVGAIGRPANDGATHVWYCLAEHDEPGSPILRTTPGLQTTFVPVAYDHERLAREMRAEALPEEFVETILTGWWTTCLEILPARERHLGRH